MYDLSEFKILEEKVAEFEKQKNEAIKEQKFEDAANSFRQRKTDSTKT